MKHKGFERTCARKSPPFEVFTMGAENWRPGSSPVFPLDRKFEGGSYSKMSCSALTRAFGQASCRFGAIHPFETRLSIPRPPTRAPENPNGAAAATALTAVIAMPMTSRSNSTASEFEFVRCPTRWVGPICAQTCTRSRRKQRQGSLGVRSLL